MKLNKLFADISRIGNRQKDLFVKKSNLMEYFSDEAIKSPLDDKLGHSHFSYYLAKCILNFEKVKNSYVIGICGKWGDGKTSAINMALVYLEYLFKNPNDSIDNINQKIKEKQEKEICKKENLHKEFPSWRIKLNTFLAALIFLALTVYLIFIWPLPLLLDNYIFISPFYFKIIFKIFVQISLFYFILEKFSSFFINLLLSPVYVKEPIIKLKDNFLDLFKQKDFVRIEFDPWNYTNSESILKEFFKQLSNGIGKQIDFENFKAAAKLISVYSKLILNKDISVFESFWFV